VSRANGQAEVLSMVPQRMRWVPEDWENAISTVVLVRSMPRKPPD
jgi:hypothetical protein